MRVARVLTYIPPQGILFSLPWWIKLKEHGFAKRKDFLSQKEKSKFHLFHLMEKDIYQESWHQISWMSLRKELKRYTKVMLKNCMNASQILGIKFSQKNGSQWLESEVSYFLKKAPGFKL